MLRRSLVSLVILLCTAGTLLAQERVMRVAPIEYELSFGKPNSHLLEIAITAKGLEGKSADFAMPAWSPGWYIINNYAKMVQEFRARNAAGKPLAWRKTDKQTWRVTLGGSTTARIEYKLYGNTLAVDWVQYNDKHAHIAGPAAWMYLVGGKQRGAALKITTPQGWRVATGMAASGANTFTAPDYDAFIDSPIEISDYTEQTFSSGGATYHIIVHDILGKKDYTRLTQDTQKAVENLVEMMKPVAAANGRSAPYQSYWFLFHIWPNTGGGLEHRNSTQIFMPFDWDAPAAGDTARGLYRAQIGVTAHEFFHAYNVKRMRPLPLGPFDYSREVHSPSLWISEGFTNYYEGMALLRTGIETPEDYFESLGQLITGFENLPGRRERSIEDTSWDTWFWYTGEGPIRSNKANVDHSYYTGGEILGHFLDFAIRHATQNKKSLDDWMRLMYSRYALPKPGFTPQDVIRTASEVAGRDLSEFFRKHISGKEPLPYEEYFALVGLQVERKRHPERAWLGATLGERNNELVAGNILPESPALAAGLDRDDAIAAVDGAPMNRAALAQLLERKKPGDTIVFSVRRLRERLEIPVKLGSDPTVEFVVTPMAQMSEAQRSAYQYWLRGK